VQYRPHEDGCCGTLCSLDGSTKVSEGSTVDFALLVMSGSFSVRIRDLYSQVL
jgi:hypothetical protein